MMHVVYKTVDEDRYMTLTADADLTFALEDNSVYAIRGALTFVGSATGDVKHGFSCGGGTLLYGCGCAAAVTSSGDVTAVFDTAYLVAGTTKGIVLSTGVPMTVKFSILFKTSSAGNFSVFWAQNTLDAVTPTALLAGSLLSYEKLP
jgi:hypothetical protein